MASHMATGSMLGAGFVLLTTVLWISASFLAQYLVRPDAWGHTPQLEPILLVFICTSLFSVYIPIMALKRRCHGRTSRQEDEQQAAGLSQCEGPWLKGMLNNAIQVLPVASIWFAAQYSFTLSLANTSVTSNTILSSSSSMFTLLASALVLQERITCAKLLSVTAVMAGTAMVTLADGSGGDSSHSLLGDALCVLSAILYSCYTVTMQKQLQHDDADTPALFFGYIGCMTAVIGLPLTITCHILGLFDIWALDPKALGLAGVNGISDYVLADYTWARAVLLLGPTVATLGMSVQIPLATLADLVLGHPHWLDSSRSVMLTAAGTAAILAGVVGINLGGSSSSSSSSSGSHPANAQQQHGSHEPLLQPDEGQA